MSKALPRRRSIAGAIIAGAAAGVTILVWFALINLALLHTPGFTLARFFAFNAAALVGNVAYTRAAYVALGVVLHFLIAVGWAIGYAFVAERERQLLTRPVISGAAFGLIVYFAMQLVLVAANLYRIPTPGELGVALVAHIVFYGIPVALIVARVHRPA